VNGFSRLELLIILMIVVLTAVGFYQVVGHDFVAIDDQEYVTKNDHVRGGLTAEGVLWAFHGPHGSNWHPLTSLSHMLDCTLFGLNAGRHHAVNWLLHTVNACLLFLVISRMASFRHAQSMAPRRVNRAMKSHRKRGSPRRPLPPKGVGQDVSTVWKSAIVAALFAVHPLHVESVAWISERKDVLSTLFWLLTMAAYLGYIRRPSWSRYLSVGVLLALGLMSKPMVVTLPFVLLLLDLWPLDRVKNGPVPVWNSHARDATPTWRMLLLEKLPWLALVAVSSIMTFYVQRQSGAMHTSGTIPINARLQNAVVSYVLYLWKTVWPVGLAYFYPHPLSYGGLAPSAVLGSALLLVLATLAIVYGGRRKRYLWTGWFWYLGTLVPVIGIVQVGDQAMADRYTYIPLIGIFIIVVWGAADLAAWSNVVRHALKPAAVGVLALLTILTWRQVRTWHDTGTLAGHAIEVTKGNFSAWYLYGVSEMKRGDDPAAMTAFRRSLRINPDFTNARFDLAKLLIDAGQLDDAEKQLQRVALQKPALARKGLQIIANQRAVAWVSRGSRFLDQGKAEQAAECFRKALQANPRYAEALNNLAWILATSPNKAIRDGSQALRLARRAIEIRHSSMMLDTLAAAYAENGQFDRAVEIARQTIELARRDPRQSMPPGIDDRLKRYQAGQPYRDR